MTDNGIASIVRSLAEGVDPGRVLRDVANEALSRTAASHVLLAAMLEGRLTPLVAIGPSYPLLLQAGEEAFSAGRAARRSDPGAGLAAVAVPVRFRGDVIAVLAAAGRDGAAPRPLEPEPLAALADCAALALSARPGAGVLHGAAAGAGADPDFTSSLAAVAAAGTVEAVAIAALDVAAARFGARSGFLCLPDGPDGVEVVGWRGLDRERLGAASRHPGFARLISGAALSVLAPTDAAVAQLTAGAEFAVCLPVSEGAGPGALVLLVAEEPDDDGRRALGALGAQVAAGVRAARAAAAVEAAGSRLAALLQAVPDPVLVIDEGGCFAALNAAAAELFALSDSFELGRPARGRLGHPGLEALLLGTDTGAGATGTPVGPAAGEVVLGRPTPRRYRPAARTLPGGGRVLVLRAMTAASPAGSDDGDVAAALGRALREPLAAIAALTAGNGNGPGPAGDGFATGDWDVARKAIAAEAARLEAVADQMALLSSDGRAADAVAVRPERLDVVAVVGMVVGARRAARPDRLITLAAPARLDAVVDRRLLERVVDPLVDNALRYSDGPVTVEVADRGETFEIAVLDAGPGIFSGDIPGLFERFHPLDGSPVRRGAGVSLHTGRRLAELMGGRLWCDSRLGVGSRFAVRLPHAPATR